MGTEAKQAARTFTDKLNRLCGNQIAIIFDDEDRQYFCLCHGMWRGKFFLTQIPMDSDIQDKLTLGKSAVVRFVEAGMLCRFKTRIHKVLTDPFPLIFFDYPNRISMTNLRSSKRVAVFLPALIQWDGEEYGGAIRDLSEGGCLLIMSYEQDEAFSSIEVGSTFLIKFQMHGETAPTELNGKVVRLKKDREELRMGISFQENSENTISKIRNYVAHMGKILEGEQSG